MGNCLITRLKGSVDNENLPVFNEVKMKLTVGAHNFMMRSNLSNNCQIYGDTGVAFTVYNGITPYTNPFTLTGNMQGFTARVTTEGYIKITNKNLVASRDGDTFAVDGVKEVVGGLESLIVPSDAKTILFRNSPIRITEEYIKFITKDSLLVSFNFQGCSNSDFNISSFSDVNGITTLNVSSTKAIGTIESIAEGQVSMSTPRTSGTITITGNGYITAGGAIIANNAVKYIYFGTSMSDYSPTEDEIAQGWCIR